MNQQNKSQPQCPFCRIVAGKAEADIIFSDEKALAFWDANPKAPVHILIIPRRHIASVNHIGQEDEETIGHLFTVARSIAEKQGIHDEGYRLMVNTGEKGGQTIDHLHLHLLGGKHLGRY